MRKTVFKEYILNSVKKPARRIVNEETPADPCEALRMHGIKIKYTKPYKDCLEIATYQDPADIDLSNVLRGFEYTVRDSKLFVRYKD